MIFNFTSVFEFWFVYFSSRILYVYYVTKMAFFTEEFQVLYLLSLPSALQP